MKKKSLSAKKKIHNKLLINLKNPLIYKIYKDFNNFIKINLNQSNFSNNNFTDFASFKDSFLSP